MIQQKIYFFEKNWKACTYFVGDTLWFNDIHCDYIMILYVRYHRIAPIPHDKQFPLSTREYLIVARIITFLYLDLYSVVYGESHVC